MQAISVMIVDDSWTMRNILKKLIQASGLEVKQFTEAGDGQAAFDALGKQKSDLLLVDLNMPVMNGMQLIEKLRTTPEFSRLPVLVVSTESSEQRIAEIKAKGIRFLHKPFIPEQVREIVEEMMEELNYAG